MPPHVTSGSPRDFTSRPLQDKDVLYNVGLSQRGISNRLGGDRLSTPSSLIRGDQNPGLAIVNSITEGFRRETSEDDRVYGTDTCAGEESSHGLPVHGKIDADGVTLLDTEGFENVGDSAYFAQEFGIGDVAAFAWLVGFVDNGSLWEVVSVKLKRYNQIMFQRWRQLAPCRGFGGDLALFAAYPIKAKRGIVWREDNKNAPGFER